MKSLNYSSITALLRRIHMAKKRADETGIPVKELLERDRLLRKQLQAERREREERRRFLRTAGGLGLGASLLPFGQVAFAHHSPGHGTGNDGPSIAIIGGGTGGLRTAHRLMQYGIDSTVYEANTRLGGRMYSDRSFFSDNRVVEWGGEFISTEHNALRNLAHQLGLELEDVNKLSVGDEETYWIEGQLYSESNLMDVWVDGLYDIMNQAEMAAPWQPMYNTVHTPEHIMYDNMDAIDWMESIGLPSSDWVHKLLLADLVAEYGITVGNSALNLIYLLGFNNRGSGGLPLAGTDERLHVVGGNDQVPLGMAAQLPQGSIDTGRKLEAIVGDYSGPYTLVFDTGPDENCDVLVLALPFNLIADIDIDSRIFNSFLPQKQQGILSAPTNNVSDNGKIMMEFTDRHWDLVREIDGEDVHMAARAYSFAGEMGSYSGFISTWEGEPGNPSPLGVLVDYNGGFEARNLKSNNLHGVAKAQDVNRVLSQAENIWPGISAKYNGKAVVSNWIDDPFAHSAFTSPSVGTMTSWWGAHWVSEGNIYFAGEAYDEEFWSYMNGAVLSGERVAQEIQQNY